MQIRGNLSRVVTMHDFVRRGDTFYRVHGDGVLQTLKFRKEPVGYATYVLGVGLQSMYAELSPQMFTSQGSVQQYTIVNIAGQKLIPNWSKSALAFVEFQLDILKSEGLIWLDCIKTQQQLSEAFVKLDNVEGDTIWNDENKIVPYLRSGEFENAQKVIGSILEQHRTADYYNRTYTSRLQRQRYIQLRTQEDAKLEQLLKMILAKDTTAVHRYLMANYLRNVQHAQFCMG